MKLRVTQIQQETSDAVSISFKNGGWFNKLSYRPGQFLTLHVPVGDAVYKRAYSFSSNPYTDGDLKITVKRVEKGVVSNYLNDHLKVGDQLKIDKPGGSFTMAPVKELKRQFVFFAGGSGITPIYSILNTLLLKEPQSSILLVYANQHYNAIIFRESLELLHGKYGDRLSIEHILDTNKEQASNFHSGLVNESLLHKIFKKHGVDEHKACYMICGPFGYMERVKGMLREFGVRPDHIQVEVFKSPPVKLNRKDLVSKVEIHINNTTHTIKVNGNKSILQAAMANNILLPYSCRSGMCASCKATCITGIVQMTEGHLLDPEEVDRGKILTCVSYPASENIVIAL
jgi:ring-1,2-phenylacetyl-CoA epoxidase subunit PaaE